MYGIDGPYYIVQVRHIISYGCLKYLDPPLVFYMLIPFYIMFPDVMFGLKFGISLYVALTAALLYMLFSRFNGSFGFMGFLAAMLSIFSPFTLRLATDFIKNAVGLLFIVLTLYAIFHVKRNRIAYTIILLSVVATSLSHILDFGVLVALVTIMSVYTLLRFKGERVLLGRCRFALITSIVILVVFLLYPQIVGYDVRKLFSFVKDVVEEADEKPLPVFSLERSILAMIIGIGGLVYSTRRGDPKFLALIFSSSTLIIALNLPLIDVSWLFRFNLMCSILIPLILPLTLKTVKDTSVRSAITLVILGFMITLTIPMMMSIRPSIPLEEYEELHKVFQIIPKNSTVIVPNTKLRYWVEALFEEGYNIVRKPQYLPGENTYLLVELTPRHKIPPGKPIYTGKHILLLKIR